MELTLYPRTETQNRPINEQFHVLVPEQSSFESNPQASIENALKAIFPENAEENNILRIRKTLGERVRILSDEQIGTIITEFQFLINGWLDEFEKEVFDGKTLKQVLNE